MKRIYRIRDTQRFLFLVLLFPLLPLLLTLVPPARNGLLFGFAALFVLFVFWMLFRTRDLEVGREHIRIDAGRLAQEMSHEWIQEIYLKKNGLVLLRVAGRNRYIRVLTRDYTAVSRALDDFAKRHAIPLTDQRTRREIQERGGKGYGVHH